MPLKEDTYFSSLMDLSASYCWRIHGVSWDGPVTQGVINWLQQFFLFRFVCTSWFGVSAVPLGFAIQRWTSQTAFVHSEEQLGEPTTGRFEKKMLGKV